MQSVPLHWLKVACDETIKGQKEDYKNSNLILTKEMIQMQTQTLMLQTCIIGWDLMRHLNFVCS